MDKLNDFKSLKGLLKKTKAEEKAVPFKAEKAKTIKKPQEKTHSSPLGRRVEMMTSDDRGVIVEMLDDKKVEIELDSGLLITAGPYDYAITDQAEEKRLFNSVSGKLSKDGSLKEMKGDNSSTLEVDLHISAIPGGKNVPERNVLNFQLETFRSVIREQSSHKGRHIIFIHGIGDGTLRRALRKELDEVLPLTCAYSIVSQAVIDVAIK